MPTPAPHQDQTDQAADQQATDRAAAEAVRAVAASYLLETAGRPLNHQQRDLRLRAERLARHLDRTQSGKDPR